MSKIRVLSEHTINKIAAGEVIENPASVVKELVENSLDAGASAIEVEIRAGGRQLIRITDNGCGMGQDDALLCFERHATSKLKEVEDLQTIATMGFRGEAVPSIGAISKLLLRTCLQGQTVGTLVKMEGGQIKSVSAAPCPEGTTFEVRDLFFNVPVRKNFQRSPAFDAQEIQRIVTQLALGNPHIRFTLINNQETLLSARGNTLEERIREVLGKEFLNGLTQVKLEGDIHLEGFLGQPSASRPNRTGQYLFINRRGVSSSLVSYALREGYGTALAPQRHPIYVLHITLPGTWVDVNVHPQKREVRLRQEQALKELLMESVGQALRPTLTHDFKQPFAIPESFTDHFQSKQNFSYSFPTPQREIELRDPPANSYTPTLFKETPVPSFKIAPKVLTTLPGYILIESDHKIALVDQQRAHRRIIFEQLQNQSELNQQQLLIPFTIELSPAECTSLKLHLEQFNQMGIALREFGPNSFAIDALPTSFGNVDVQELVLDLLKKIADYQDSHAFQRQQALLIASAAAKAAIQRNRKLSTSEAEKLIERLWQCAQPDLCPHGKNIQAPLREEEFSKWF